MNSDSEIEIIRPDWPASGNIHAFCSTRKSGVSRGEFSGLNLALHVEDNPQYVALNRQQLKQQLHLPAEPLWLNQVHGTQVINASATAESTPDADASYATISNQVCVVMTADCLPVLICNRKSNKVAAAHAGWRGLADGVIEKTIESLNEKPEELLVWLGPAIGPDAFEVGEDVYHAFVADLPQAEIAFKANRPGHYLADIYQLARLRLNRLGVNAIYGGEYCTCSDVDHFYSYRRDGKTGRQASLIWFE